MTQSFFLEVGNLASRLRAQPSGITGIAFIDLFGPRVAQKIASDSDCITPRVSPFRRHRYTIGYTIGSFMGLDFLVVGQEIHEVHNNIHLSVKSSVFGP